LGLQSSEAFGSFLHGCRGPAVSSWKRAKTKTHTVFLLAKLTPLNINIGSDRFAMFNKERGIFNLNKERSLCESRLLFAEQVASLRAIW
jgi:hypothetical protein